MSEAQSTDALVKRFADGTAPPQVRAAAARGALPLPRPVLTHLLVILLRDEDEQIRRDAGNTLDGYSKDAVKEVLTDQDCSPEVLSHYAFRSHKDEAAAEWVVFHPATPLLALASLFLRRNNELVAEILLIRSGKILLAQPLYRIVRGFQGLVGNQHNHHGLSLFDVVNRLALLVEQKGGNVDG